jgi:hypothetical protein
MFAHQHSRFAAVSLTPLPARKKPAHLKERRADQALAWLTLKVLNQKKKV